MEVPNPTRIGSADRRLDRPAADSGTTRRQYWARSARLASLDAKRVATLILLLLAGTVALIYAGSLALDSAVRWLHQQSEYQINFNEIEVSPPPPASFVGGTSRFLERVRQEENESARIPMLDDARSQRVFLAFSKFPWVHQVRRISYASKKIRVELEYYEPVAYLQINESEQMILDASGHVLPVMDVDTKARPLIRIVAPGLTADANVKPGLTFKTADEAKTREVLNAAHLAGFLMAPERRLDPKLPPLCQVASIDLENPHPRKPVSDDIADDLFVVNRNRSFGRWRPATGPDTQPIMSEEDFWKWYKDASIKALEKPKAAGSG